MKTLSWLRSFLHLDATRKEENISAESILLQERSVLTALDILEREPGVLLADEVGMGKTFEALGIIACALAANPKAHCIVITPRPVLNDQWIKVAGRFRDKGFYRFAPEALGAVSHIHDLPDACRKHSVVFAPVNVFTSGRSPFERGALLHLWFHQRGIAGPTRAAILRRLNEADLRVEDSRQLFGRSVDATKELPARAFRRVGKDGDRGLEDLLDQGLDTFQEGWPVHRALSRARYHLVASMLPRFDLLVVDEAHKLKNPWTVQSQAVSQVLDRHFDKALFLTATPFQLGVSELRQVFEIFGRARDVDGGFKGRVDELFEGIRTYQEAYDRFEAAWKYVEQGQAKQFGLWYAGVRARQKPEFEGIEDPNVLSLARMAAELRQLKEEKVQRGFRQWTIRNLKPRKLERRDQRTHLVPSGNEAAVPILLYHRLMEERRQAGRQTHIAAAQTNIASSFEAALEGALVKGEERTNQVQAYQRLVQRVLERSAVFHPKVEAVVNEAFEAGRQDEKALVFCERIATIQALKDRIQERWMEHQLGLWRQVFRKGTHESIFGTNEAEQRTQGEFQKLAQRFTKAQDPLTLALRECYPYTLLVARDEDELPQSFWDARDLVIEESNRILKEQLSSGTSAARPDFRIARRCIDQAVARWFEKHRPKLFGQWDDICPKAGLVAGLLDKEYVSVGLDGEIDEEEKDMRGRADTVPQWTITESVFSAVLRRGQRSIWFPFRERLARFGPKFRDAVVDAVRFYLTRREVPFLVELLRRAGGPGSPSRKIRQKLDAWWSQDDCPWTGQVREFLEYLPRFGGLEQKDILTDALKGGHFVQTTLDAESRSRKQNAFNTPFYPMVLVGNQTMQEGLDLHRACRRVIHHDLRWNPADLEQRTGRVDRHGSLSEKLETNGTLADWKIRVGYPLLERTSDPHQYRVVKEREKWLNFLLGRPPAAGTEDIEAQDWIPLPKELAEDLRVDLSPLPIR